MSLESPEISGQYSLHAPTGRRNVGIIPLGLEGQNSPDAIAEAVENRSAIRIQLELESVWNVTELHLGPDTYYLGRQSDANPEGVEEKADPTRLVVLNRDRKIMNADFQVPRLKDKGIRQLEDPRASDVTLSNEQLALFGLEGPIAAVGVTTVAEKKDEHGETVDDIEWNNGVLLVGKDNDKNLTVQRFINLPRTEHCKNTVIRSVAVREEDIDGSGNVQKVLAIRMESRNHLPHTFFESEVLLTVDGEEIYKELGITEHPEVPWNKVISGLGGGSVIKNDSTGRALEVVHGQQEDFGNLTASGDPGRLYSIDMGMVEIVRNDETGELKKIVHLADTPRITPFIFPDMVKGKQMGDHRKGIRSVYPCHKGYIVINPDGNLAWEGLISRGDLATYRLQMELSAKEIEWVGEKELREAVRPSQMREESSLRPLRLQEPALMAV